MADLDLNRAFRDYHYAREHLVQHAMACEFIYDCRGDSLEQHPPGPGVLEALQIAQDLARLACAVTNQDGYRHPAPISEQVTQLETLAQALNQPFEIVPNRVEEGGYYNCPTCDGEGTLPAEQVIQYHQGLIGAQVYGFGDETAQLETWLHHGPEKTLQLITEFKRLQTENQKLRDDRERDEALHQETAKELRAAKEELVKAVDHSAWSKRSHEIGTEIHLKLNQMTIEDLQKTRAALQQMTQIRDWNLEDTRRLQTHSMALEKELKETKETIRLLRESEEADNADFRFVEKLLRPSWSNDMPWQDEILIAFENAILAAKDEGREEVRKGLQCPVNDHLIP